jgi:hypothetical protein
VSTQLEPLILQIKVDMGQFQAMFDQAQEVMSKFQGIADGLNETLDNNSAAFEASSQATDQSSSAMEAAAGPYGAILEKALDLAGGLFKVGQAAIEAANLMDPKGAKEYSDAQNKLADTVLTVAGNLGKELRPIVEAVTNKLQEMAAWALRIDFGKIFADLKVLGTTAVKAASDAWDALQGLWEQAQPWADMLGKILFMPADIMRKGFTEAIGGVLSLISQVAAAGEKLGLLSPGWADAFKDAGDTVKAMGGSFYQDLKDGTEIALKGAKDLAKSATDRYASGPASPIAGISAGTRKQTEDAQKAQDAAQKLLAAADLSHAQALGSLHQQDSAQQLQSASQLAAILTKGAETAFSTSHGAFEAANKLLEEAYQHGGASQIAFARQAAQVNLQSEQDARDAVIGAADAAAAIADQQSAESQASQMIASAGMIAAQVTADVNHTTATVQAATQAVKILEGANKASFDAAGKAASAHVEAAKIGAQVTTEAAKDAAKLTKEASDYAKASALSKAALDATQSAITGSAGSVFGAARAGLEGADPMKAAIGAGIAIIAKSEGFQSLLGALNTVIDAVGGALGKLFQGLAPLVQMAGNVVAPVLNALGDVMLQVGQAATAILVPLLQGMEPMMGALGSLVTALGPLIPLIIQIGMLTSGEGPAMMILGEAMKLLAPAVQLLAEGTKVVVDAIVGVWNWVVGEVQGLLMQLAKLPFVGDAFKDMATSLDSMKVQTNAATDAAQSFAVALTSTAQAALDAQKTKEGELAKIQQLFALIAQTKEGDGHDGYQLTSHDQALIAEYTKEIAAAQKAADMAALQAQLAQDQGWLDASKKFGVAATDTANAQDAVNRDQMAILAATADATVGSTDANTKATHANTAAINAMNNNMPSFYRLSGATNETLGIGSGLGGSSGGGGTTININGSMNFHGVQDVEAFRNEMEKLNSRANVRRFGAPVGGPRGLTTPPNSST